MPVTSWIDEETGVLWQKWTGFVTGAEVIDFERSMREAKLSARNAIIDVTELTGSNVTPGDMTNLADMPQSAERIAIVAPTEARFGRARMFELMAEPHSTTTLIRVFRSSADALYWLFGSTAAQPESGLREFE